MKDDRRSAPRFDLELPLTVKLLTGEARTKTDDLSSHGVQFSLDEDQVQHLPETLEFRVTLPSEVTLSTPREVCCQARIVRKVRSEIKRVAVSARIENYCAVPKGHA